MPVFFSKPWLVMIWVELVFTPERVAPSRSSWKFNLDPLYPVVLIFANELLELLKSAIREFISWLEMFNTWKSEGDIFCLAFFN
jgi:hypothetical protein